MADRNQAKQRRQAQNRARRAEIAARSDAARRKIDEPDSKGRPARTTKGVASATGKGGSRPTGRAAGGRSPRVPVQRGGLLGKFGWNEAGGQAVILGAAATVLASIALIFVKIIPVDGPWEVLDRAAIAGSTGTVSAAQRADILTHAKVHTETLLRNAGSRGWLFLALPVVLTWLTVLIARPSNRKRTWVMGAIAMFLFVMLYQQLGIFYIVPFGAFAWGSYQAYKMARLERMVEAGTGGAISTTARDTGGRADADPDDDLDGDDLDGDESAGGGRVGANPVGPRPGIFSALFKPQPRVARSAGRPRRGMAGNSTDEVDDDE